MHIAVFLDRDGTLNEEVGYISRVEDLRLISGAAHAIKRLNQAGVLAILTTNQSGPARGLYDEAHVAKLNERLVMLLEEEAQAHLDALFYCPHLPEGTVKEYVQQCTCRKPGTTMMDWALEKFPDIDLLASYVVGDKATDVEMAYNAQCKGILLKTGYGSRVLAGTYQHLVHSPHAVCETIAEAVDLILKESPLKGRL